MASDRHGDWGSTFTGKKFWPVDPRPEDIDIVDIAHALSNLCRFGGHCREFYSVAQHSVLLSYICEPKDALWGLLHDASEAYVVDIPRPLKYSPGMEGYKVIEKRMMRAVCEAFGLSYDSPESVNIADEVLIATEARDLMPEHNVKEWTFTHPALEEQIIPWSPSESKQKFLDRFYELLNSKQNVE